MKIQVKINRDNENLYCTYYKELIPIDEKYLEVTDYYLDDVIINVYSYECMDMLVNDHMEEYDESPDIFGDF